jgi:hypothetical protein
MFIWDYDNPIENRKNKPWILFLNQSNIEEEWNKKTIRKIKGLKTGKKIYQVWWVKPLNPWIG